MPLWQGQMKICLCLVVIHQTAEMGADPGQGDIAFIFRMDDDGRRAHDQQIFGSTYGYFSLGDRQGFGRGGGRPGSEEAEQGIEEGPESAEPQDGGQNF